MSNSKTRFALLMGVVCTALAATEIGVGLYSGSYTLPFGAYITGAFSLLLTVGAGIGLVWLAKWLLQWREILRQEHHSKRKDEQGSHFNFPVTLQRLVPDTLVSPSMANTTPLERELLGFWQNFRSWPQRPNKKDSPKLHTLATTRWEKCHTANATPMVRIMALALDLGLTYAIQEIRKPYPWWQFWRRDAIKYSLRCRPHTGLDAFVLTTFASFRTFNLPGLSEDMSQRTLLCALRFYNTPHQLPVNSEPAAKQAINQLHALLEGQDVTTPQAQPTTPDHTTANALRVAFNTYGLGTLEKLNWGGATPQTTHDGVLLNNDGALLRLKPFLAKLISICPAEIRDGIKAWGADETQLDALLPLAAELLKEQGWLQLGWEGVPTQSGLFTNVTCNAAPYANCVILNLQQIDLAPLKLHLQALDAFTGALKLETDASSHASQAKARSQRLDQTYKQVMQQELCGSDA